MMMMMMIIIIIISGFAVIFKYLGRPRPEVS
jgi:hypothetical protein